ncbi:MAG: tetratricopeptide repeat protein [Myxococcota bacterium]|jgi:tetratricopeptide (TPR) repeat protein|nr:tetratricopeptide repeat protein [Myxococcota bacterium]
MIRPAQLGFIGLFIAASALGACGGGVDKQEGTIAPSPPSASEQQEAAGYMEKAVLAESEGDLATAYDSYIQAATVFDRTGGASVERAEAHFLAAEKALALSKFEEAVKHYDTAVQIYLRFEGNSQAKAAVALTNMGAAYKKTGQKEKARDCWTRALEVYQALPAELRNSANIAILEQNIRDLDNNI